VKHKRICASQSTVASLYIYIYMSIKGWIIGLDYLFIKQVKNPCALFKLKPQLIGQIKSELTRNIFFMCIQYRLILDKLDTECGWSDWLFLSSDRQLVCYFAQPLKHRSENFVRACYLKSIGNKIWYDRYPIVPFDSKIRGRKRIDSRPRIEGRGTVQDTEHFKFYY
jgi:hypothetical protein